MNLLVATLATHWKNFFMNCYLQFQYWHDPKLRSEKQCKEELHALRSSPFNIGVINWKREGWVGHVSLVGVEEKCLQDFDGEIRRIKANWTPKSRLDQGWPTFDPRGKYLRLSVTWIISSIQFNKHDVTGLQNIIWQLFKQRKCLEKITHHFYDSTQQTDISLCFTEFNKAYYISMVKLTRCTNVSNLFYFGITLHVSDDLSVHHREFTTVHTATGICLILLSAC